MAKLHRFVFFRREILLLVPPSSELILSVAEIGTKEGGKGHEVGTQGHHEEREM